MNKEECIDIVNEHDWSHLIFKHANEIDEEFWEEFISEINIEDLLQRRRMSDEFLDLFKDTMGKKLYKKYKAIYFLCELSEDDDQVYVDITKTYLSQIRLRGEISYMMVDFAQNGQSYTNTTVLLLADYIKDYYDSLGNKSLSYELLSDIARTYLKIQEYHRDYGFLEQDHVKEYFGNLKASGYFYRMNVSTNQFDDIDETGSVIILSFEPVKGIGFLDMNFLTLPITPFNFSI